MTKYVNMKPTSVIKVRLGIEPNGRVQKFFTETCAKHMDKYVPFKRGILANYTLEKNAVVYEQLYAQYQYYGVRKDGTHQINPANRTRTKHPLATSYWDKKMVSAEINDVVKELQDFIGGK